MRKAFVILLLVVLVLSFSSFLNVRDENSDLKNKLKDLQLQIDNLEDDKEVYVSKQKELDELKDNNKDKLGKYKEVEVWNQEIIEYLD